MLWTPYKKVSCTLPGVLPTPYPFFRRHTAALPCCGVKRLRYGRRVTPMQVCTTDHDNKQVPVANPPVLQRGIHAWHRHLDLREHCNSAAWNEGKERLCPQVQSGGCEDGADRKQRKGTSVQQAVGLNGIAGNAHVYRTAGQQGTAKRPNALNSRRPGTPCRTRNRPVAG